MGVTIPIVTLGFLILFLALGAIFGLVYLYLVVEQRVLAWVDRVWSKLRRRKSKSADS